MVRVGKSERNLLLLLLNKAVTLQVQLYDQLAAIEELTGCVTGLDEWVRREAAAAHRLRYGRIRADVRQAVAKRHDLVVGGGVRTRLTGVAVAVACSKQC